MRNGLHRHGAFDHYISQTNYAGNPMKPIFVQLQCAPGKTYEVADAIYQTELVSELYSTSGDYDLLLKVYIEEGQDIGKFINDNIANIPGIVRSLTTLTFKAF
ncbi:transcriptional regulator protein [Rhizobium phaseoli Ch24-10]|nr:transcriptional regulator protein [Rhizobium phaseoli Ch24-10]